MHTRIIFIHKWKEGETGKQRERQRKIVCESESIAERRMLASVIKLAIGKIHRSVFGISYEGLTFSGKLF
jgi:hypothetical protein